MFVLQVAVVKGGGGITTAVRHYARMFDRVGVRHACVYRGPDDAALRAEGLDIIQAPPSLTARGIASLLPHGALRAEVTKRGEPAAIIVHSDLALAAMARMFPNAWLVTPCHSDKTKHKRRAHLVVTLNADQDARVRAGLRGAQSLVALLGNPYVPPADATPPTADGPPRVNFVGRFIDTKDPLALVKAATLMQAKPAFRFIGAGELDAETRAAASAALLDAEFPGWISKPFAQFHRNDMLVLPSHWEGLPYLLLEALDHSVPTIASDIPGNRAALGDGAYGELYTLGDAQALARTLDQALANLDALRAKAEKGRAAVAAHYGAEAFWTALKSALGLVA
ncbi:MAG TPA: glycosyltransferase [Caulobacterales bacterium]|nr:glycosyltransferase [Caulobacterales bacterium]